MIQKYLDYLKESNGISEVNKDYTEELFSYFDNINKNIVININNNVILKLKNLNLIIEYGNIDYYSIFNPKNFSLDNNILNDIILLFKIPTNPNIIKVKQLISHELNHLIEFFNIVKNNRNIPRHGLLKINIENFKKFNYNNFFETFIHYIYLTLDNEFNARVAETYQYLKSLNIKDEKLLLKYLYNSPMYIKVQEIEHFDSIRFSKFLINEIGLDATIVFLNLFNNSINKDLKIKFKTIKDYNDITRYFEFWKTKFEIKLNKHKNKLLKIVVEVIND